MLEIHWEAVMMTIERHTSRTCASVMPRSPQKASPIIGHQLVKPGPSVAALLTWHCVFEDKDNCVKFLLRTLLWLRRTASGFQVLASDDLHSVWYWNVASVRSLQRAASLPRRTFLLLACTAWTDDGMKIHTNQLLTLRSSSLVSTHTN